MAEPVRQYHHGDLRRVLLDATAELVGEVGPFSWSLREVARRAGVSHAAPAYHFGDKAGLLLAVATEGFEKFAAALAAAEPTSPDEDPFDAFHRQGLAYLTFAREHRGPFDLMFRCDVYEPDDAYLIAAARSYEWLELGAERIAAAAGRDDVADIAAAAWATAHGLATLAAMGLRPANRERLGDESRILAVFIDSLRPRS